MKKYIIAGVLVVALVVYLVFTNKDSVPAAVTSTTTPTSTIPTPTSTPTSPSEGLAFGATGSQVSSLQQFLIANNYLTAVSAPTGYFGPLTKAALIQFQTSNNISPATGAIDAQTEALINTLGMANTTTTATTGQYKDGTYTGSVADAFYGNLQVMVTIQGGAITNVTFPQAPSGGHSSDVSAQALPVLAQEAITAQRGNVNVVSGATQDSQAFQQSMASALAQAKA